MLTIILIAWFAAWNVIRGGWLPIPARKVAFGLSHPILWPWLGIISIPVAIGSWLGSTTGWGVYVGAILNGKYDYDKPQSEVDWIDAIIRPLSPHPVAYGVAGCFLRGLMWSAIVMAFIAPSIHYLGGSWLWLIGAFGYSAMPVGFLLSRGTSHDWRHGEAINGAIMGLFWAVAVYAS